MRVRLLLVVTLWVVTVLALAFWLGEREQQAITIGAGPAGSEGFLLVSSIADVINDMDRGRLGLGTNQPGARSHRHLVGSLAEPGERRQR